MPLMISLNTLGKSRPEEDTNQVEPVPVFSTVAPEHPICDNNRNPSSQSYFQGQTSNADDESSAVLQELHDVQESMKKIDSELDRYQQIMKMSAAFKSKLQPKVDEPMKLKTSCSSKLLALRKQLNK